MDERVPGGPVDFRVAFFVGQVQPEWLIRALPDPFAEEG